MADKKPATKSAKKDTFSAEERAAMKERARELKAQKSRAAGESDLLEKIAEMPQSDRTMAERIHAIVSATAPDLAPKTWYGMPAYANEDGKVVCFFKPASKFGARYATLGFEDAAMIDDGEMFPTSFGVKELVPADEARIADLVRKAVS